jgi:hypothetical protein
VRALLRKMDRRVLVGDHVRVAPVDWVAGRGVVDGIAHRSSELADPAVANVDHVLLLFGLMQPPVRRQRRLRDAAAAAVTCCCRCCWCSMRRALARGRHRLPPAPSAVRTHTHTHTRLPTAV